MHMKVPEKESIFPVWKTEFGALKKKKKKSSTKLITFCTKSGYCDLTPQTYFIPGIFSEIA